MTTSSNGEYVPAERLARLRRIETLALVWSVYQDDDSKKDQASDPWLKGMAVAAERKLLEALI